VDRDISWHAPHRRFIARRARRGIRGIVAGRSPRCLDPVRSTIAGEAQHVAVLALDAPRRIIGRSTTVAVS
jgi:hypothetical protein